MKPSYDVQRKMFRRELDSIERKMQTHRKRIALEEKELDKLEKKNDYFWDMIHELNLAKIAELDAAKVCRFCEVKLPEHSPECGRKNG